MRLPLEGTDTLVDTPPLAPTPIPEAPEEPLINFVNLHEVIDFTNTIQHHREFAYSHINFIGKIPEDVHELWDLMEDRALDKYDIYKLLTYFAYFNGIDTLNNWQKDFLDIHKYFSDNNCMFCGLPKGYWCDIVATKN